MHTKLKELLSLAVANRASDVHLMMGVPPKIRVNGELQLTPNWIEVDDGLTLEMIESLLDAKQKRSWRKIRKLIFLLKLMRLDLEPMFIGKRNNCWGIEDFIKHYPLF